MAVEFETKEEYVNRLSRLTDLLSKNDRIIKNSPGFSEEQNLALVDRRALVKDYLETVASMTAKFGVIGANLKANKKVPSNITRAISAMDDPDSAEDVALSFAPQIITKNLGNVGGKTQTNFWLLTGTPKSRKGGQLVSIEDGGFGPSLNMKTESSSFGGVPSGGGGAGGAGGVATGGGTTRSRVPKNWEAQFRRMFPEQAWLLDLDKTKYPKLFKLIQRGIADRMYETAEGQQRFAAELRNTDFYIELRDTDKVRQIKSLVGDLGFDSVPFNKFLTTASNFGWEGETLQQEVYKEAFRKDATGKYVNPTAVTRAKSSNNYLALANIGKAYFSQVADTTIENALTGGITNEDVQRQQRELAKTKYGHLANLIDQGFTLAELASPFQQQASQLLERSVDDINMGEAMFESAYNYGDAGQKRMMTSGEWEIMLRSDAKYGWDKTQNAKQEARQLASSISQAFGKVI